MNLFSPRVRRGRAELHHARLARAPCQCVVQFSVSTLCTMRPRSMSGIRKETTRGSYVDPDTASREPYCSRRSVVCPLVHRIGGAIATWLDRHLRCRWL